MSWGTVLDAFERHLDEVRAALCAGRPERVPDFSVPAGLGPLPPALRERASGLHAKCEVLAREAQALRDAASAELANLSPARPRVRPSTSPVSAFVDRAL